MQAAARWTASSRLESGEIGYAWLRHRTGEWQRMQPHDEKALNVLAVSQNRGSGAGNACAAMFGGRWEATLPQWENESGYSGLGVVGWLKSRYSEGADMALARTRWCYRSKDGKWMPFQAPQDAILEETFQALMMSAATKAAVLQQGETAAQNSVSTVVDVSTADGVRHKVLLECDVRASSVYAQMKPADAGWMSRQWSVSRGWTGEVMERLPDEELAVQQAASSVLTLVVHGAGEWFWKRRATQRRGVNESVGRMGSNARQCVAAAAKATGEPPARIEYLGVEWAHAIRGSGGAGGNGERGGRQLNPATRLSRVTLSSVPTLREFANEVSPCSVPDSASSSPMFCP